MILFAGQAQQVITSQSNGNASNPLIWDCICFPTPGDSVVIAHDVVMNVDWAVTGNGSITIQSGASFIEDAQNRAILIDNGSFYNYGTTELTNLAFTTAASGLNAGSFHCDSGLYVAPNASFENTGEINGLDSLYTLGTFTNSGNLHAANFWNDGDFTNSGPIWSDTLLNTGVFASSGDVSSYDFANDGNLQQTGNLNITNHLWNSGDMTFGVGGLRLALIGNDFFTGDTITGNASFVADGAIHVDGDFWNTHDLSGEGNICIGGNSSNSGDVQGTLDICAINHSQSFTVNIGTVASSVGSCDVTCSTGFKEFNKILSFFPNPVLDQLNIEVQSQNDWSSTVTDLNGKVVLRTSLNRGNSIVDMSSLQSGIYLFSIQFSNGVVQTSKLVVR